ncbi:MAG: RraA family protein [Arenicellales bacterium]|jgi:regulator of RNase E activity RraA|nr:RraA family protein [Arenicellales bacterium]|tara:strand:- start:1409 stop:2056 length:648 start_codon:yes stop_codon:yes gene_type:complete
MTELTKRLHTCYVSAVHDVLRGMGHNNFVLPPQIISLKPGETLAGEVYTISGHIDCTLTRHESLLAWAQVLSKVPGGKVLVCQPNTKDVALMGELSARALMVKNTLGYVVDGRCRDVDLILEADFPVFCDLNTPADIVGRWAYDRLGEPITIGTVTISSGDWLIADRDGIVIIPADIVEEVVTEAEVVMSTESEIRKAILAGMDPEQAYLKYGKF